MTTLFGKLHNHEIKLKRLGEDEEGEKKRKSLALKVDKEKDSHSDEEIMLIVQNFNIFMKHERQQEDHNKI